MTKHSKSGERATNKSHKNRSLEDHITGEAGAVVDGHGFDVKQVEVESDVKLTEDTGTGKAVIVRMFDFSANPEAFRKQIPTAQQLFNAHIGQIEGLLSTDGLKLMLDVIPRVKVSKNKKFYRITLGAEPASGHRLLERPKTLTQLANDHSSRHTD